MADPNIPALFVNGLVRAWSELYDKPRARKHNQTKKFKRGSKKGKKRSTN